MTKRSEIRRLGEGVCGTDCDATPRCANKLSNRTLHSEKRQEPEFCRDVLEIHTTAMTQQIHNDCLLQDLLIIQIR